MSGVTALYSFARRVAPFRVASLFRRFRGFYRIITWAACSKRDRFLRTYSVAKVNADDLMALCCGNIGESQIPDVVIENYLNHRFDLLGSGWVQVKHGARYKGLHGHLYHNASEPCPDSDEERGEWPGSRANVEYALFVSGLVDDDYTQIDWHVDFKSGYRWCEKDWYKYVQKGHLPGVDIKMPWELARMQHLPQMALVYANSKGRFLRHAGLAREFRNQVLDFIASNPPRFGVNWVSAMEVAIRVSNWLVAYNIFHSAGFRFDQQFISVFARSVYDHGLHISKNLEGSPRSRGNHYLANLAGLAFACQHLPSCGHSKKWRKFSAKELKKEMERQFFRDGSNFEGSTCYHRLATEIVIFSTAILLRDAGDISAEAVYRTRKAQTWGEPANWPTFMGPRSHKGGPALRFPEWYIRRLSSAVCCLQEITKPNGDLPQVGDNDSGRFLNLAPAFRHEEQTTEAGGGLGNYGESFVIKENTLDVTASIEAGLTLLGEREEAPIRRGVSRDIILGLANNNQFELNNCHFELNDCRNISIAWNGPDHCFEDILDEVGLGVEPQCVRRFSVHKEVNEEWSVSSYEALGVVFRKGSTFVFVRCLSNPNRMHIAHLHNDQFALELVVDGVTLIEDPGSYLYTPLRTERDRYRSVHAHDTPWPSEFDEPARLQAVFGVEDYPAPTYASVGKHWFQGVYESGETTVVARQILLSTTEITVRDWGADCCDVQRNGAAVTRGYGVR